MATTITGTANSERLTGGDAAEIITGLGGNDLLTGLGGNDSLDGGSGADTMLGGEGNDSYFVDDVADVVSDSGSSAGGLAVDRVSSSVTYSLATGDGIEVLALQGLRNVSALGNELNNSLAGNGGNNVLTGKLGNDTLDGAAGADTLIGGVGDDFYFVDNSLDVVTEGSGKGTDTIELLMTAQNLVLADNVENVDLFRGGIMSGNALANHMVLTAIGPNAALDGQAGDDFLAGNNGADMLSGGDGSDTLQGGEGIDTYRGGRNVVSGADDFDDAMIDSSTTSSDSYFFATGSGVDTIVDGGGTADQVRFIMTGLTAAQVSFGRHGDNLEVSLAGQAGKLIVDSYYVGTTHRIEKFVLPDGTVVPAARIPAAAAARALAVPAANASLTRVQAQVLTHAMAAFRGTAGDGAGPAPQSAGIQMQAAGLSVAP